MLASRDTPQTKKVKAKKNTAYSNFGVTAAPQDNPFHYTQSMIKSLNQGKAKGSALEAVIPTKKFGNNKIPGKSSSLHRHKHSSSGHYGKNKSRNIKVDVDEVLLF
ncbi:MAG: hypothetical protein ACREOZ_00550 [Gloeomargaritales cyanobacterium]